MNVDATVQEEATAFPTDSRLYQKMRIALIRKHLTGKTGDQINTLLAVAGYNLRKLLRWIFFSPVLALFEWLEAVLNFNSPLKLHPLSQ